ncbi:MAG: molybdenum cofactor sulfurtransferase, partial [Streblomastix strix]
NHNSVLGIREYALDKGAKFKCIDMKELDDVFNNEQQQLQRDEQIYKKEQNSQVNYQETQSIQNDIQVEDQKEERITYNLFAYPAECNYSGKKYPLDLINKIHTAFVPTARLDLSKYPADFVCISFYKMFGFPSGIGALIVSTEAAKLLRKTFFGGGTVSLSVADDNFFQWMPELCARFEDGTLAFLNIAGLRHGFDALEKVGGMDQITKHTFSLEDYLWSEMKDAKHDNGKPLFEFYGDHATRDKSKQGPIINFNVLDKEGSYFGYIDISIFAAQKNIHLRTGCACNPGACYDFLHVPKDLIKGTVAHIQKNACGEKLDIVHGRPIGSIRVSFGYVSNFEDAETIYNFFTQNFRNKTAQQFEDEMQLIEIQNKNEEQKKQYQQRIA